MSDKYLFPRRLTRRDFLNTSAAFGAAMALPAWMQAADATAEPVTIGSGKWTYTLDPTWGKLPAGMKFGLGCAVVVDGKDRIYVTSRSQNPCVAVFDKDGALLETWSNDFAEKIGYNTQQVAATAHGLYWSKEGNDEFLYFTENVVKPKDKDDKSPKQGACVYKTDLKGKVLFEIGNVAKEGPKAVKFDFVNPTDVAVDAGGNIYVVDGYGSQLLHKFDKNFKLIKTAGGKGKEHGQFSVCHGVWVSTLKNEPELYIADRANNRLEVYSLDLDYKRTVPEMRLPCCFYQHAGHLYIPELGSRVSIIDAADNVVARLGDGAGIKAPDITPDKFTTPHALTVDSQGSLYVVEWIDYGRVRKFRHTPA